MSQESLEKSGNIIIAILFVSVFLVIMLLALAIIINSLNTAATQTATSHLTTIAVTNETSWLNGTTYTLSKTSTYNFTNPTITAIFNGSSGLSVALNNATVSSTGVVRNTTAIVYNNALISYTYQYFSSTTVEYAGPTIQGYILSMVMNFFALAPTIGTILAVVILIAGIVILVMYVRRMKENEGGEHYYG